MSLYGEYIKERAGRGIVETEDGFATFEFPTDKIVYIIDLYVRPEKRKTGLASQLADTICEAAISQGKEQLLGSVDLGAQGADASIKVLEAYGMKFFKSAGNMLYYIKQISKGEVSSEVQLAE